MLKMVETCSIDDQLLSDGPRALFRPPAVASGARFSPRGTVNTVNVKPHDRL